jgi:mannose-6-phosphate isomerase-like protein (cupin superfamily)
MRSVLESAARAFRESEHIKNVLNGEWTALFDEMGQQLEGIRGRMGAFSMTFTNHEIGVDLIEMLPGSAFPLHVHPGDHILYVMHGNGCVSVDSVDHAVKEGDTIYIPAEYPHGVKSDVGQVGRLVFLAFGHPHKHLSATDRMKLVKAATQSAKA